MPTVFRWRGFRFFFYSNEGFEPPHIHVERGGSTAKFWIPSVECERNRGFSEQELLRIARLVSSRSVLIEEAWHEHFSS